MNKFPQTPEEVARLIAKRDSITYNEALIAVRDCINEIELAISNEDYDLVDLILMEDLGLEPDYLDCLVL